MMEPSAFEHISQDTPLTTGKDPWPNLRRLLLAIGFLALALGIFFAWERPATEYEISIYAATPEAFWVSIGIAMGLSVIVCAIHPRDRVALASLLLAGGSILAVASLPIIRSYWFLGAADALTHLGYAEDLRSGHSSPRDLLYPGSHSASVLVAELFSISTERAMMLWITGLLAVFLLFVPLMARAVIKHPVVTVISGYSAILLLPFNNVSTIFQFHAYSIGVMFVPVVGFILIKHLQSGNRERSITESIGGWNVILFATGVTLVFIHPQVALNIVIALGTFAGVHYLFRWLATDHPLAYLRPTMGAFASIGGVWTIWSFQHWQATALLESLAGAVYYTLIGEEEAGRAASDAGVSAADIGGSLTELFMKLFFVSAIYAILALVVVALAVLTTLRYRYRQDYSVITYVGFGGVVLTPFFLAHFLGDISQYFFRHLGFAMVFLTVLGALGVFYLARSVAGSGGSPSLRVIGIWLFAAAIVLSVPVIFSSPYIFLPSSHVTHGESLGYQTTIEITDDETGWSGVRTGPGRFFDGLTPGDRPIRATGYGAEDRESMALVSAGDSGEDLYVPISQREYERETHAYRNLRFDRESFETLHRSPQSNHVYSNGDLDLYYVRSTE